MIDKELVLIERIVRISAFVARRDQAELSRISQRVIRMILFLTIAFCALLWVLRDSLFSVMFRHGRMSAENVALMSRVYAWRCFARRQGS
jgi:peptidoglycan biosynthesis protein MviN/MurJ (putative lipid II flippase)